MHYKYLVKSVPRLHKSPYRPGRPLIFMHVPKSSGMAVTQGLGLAINPQQHYDGFDGVLFGKFRSFHTISDSINLYIWPKTLPSGADLFVGHIAYSSAARDYGDGQYMTVAREPYSRITSHWLYWRTQSDTMLEPWGEWRSWVVKSRQSLEDFLSDKDLACQLDNLFLRMLLWPHPLIPEDNHIEKRHDKLLLKEALSRLENFSFIDLIENPNFKVNIESWLGQKFDYSRVNETEPVSLEQKGPLHEQMTSRALDLLEAYSRLDLKLWRAIGRMRMPQVDLVRFRERVLMANFSKHAWLMASRS